MRRVESAVKGRKGNGGQFPGFLLIPAFSRVGTRSDAKLKELEHG